jgi:hypothetical protein
MGDKSGYSRSATASKWENGGRAFGDDSLSPADGGSGGSGGTLKIGLIADLGAWPGLGLGGWPYELGG